MKSQFTYSPYWLVALFVVIVIWFLAMCQFLFFCDDFYKPGLFFTFYTFIFGIYSIWSLLDFRLEWHKLEFTNTAIIVKPFLGKDYELPFSEIIYCKEEAHTQKGRNWFELELATEHRLLVLSGKVYQNYNALKKQIYKKRPKSTLNTPNLFIKANNQFYLSFLRLVLPFVAAWVIVGIYINDYHWNNYTRQDLTIVKDALLDIPQKVKTGKTNCIEFTLQSSPSTQFRIEQTDNFILRKTQKGDTLEVAFLKKYILPVHGTLRPLEVKHTKTGTCFLELDKELNEEMHSHESGIWIALFIGVGIYLLAWNYYKKKKLPTP
jgi:hypothetical protein